MVTYASLSCQGNREYNEDSIKLLQKDKEYLFAVADGLGGQGHGDIASQTAISALNITSYDKDLQSALAANLQEAQKAVCQKKSEETCFDRMMTTLVLLQIREKSFAWGHIGDSRLYYFQDKKQKMQTSDHSVVQKLVDAGMLKQNEIRHHPDRNRLLSSVGMEWEDVPYELSDEIPRQKRQQFLLCTDGFWEYIEEEMMEKTLQHAWTPGSWLKKMKHIVEKNGRHYNMDNYSAIAVWLK